MQQSTLPGKLSFIKHSWFQILFWGLILFFVTEKVMVATRNPNFIPTVIMLGSFLVPVVFVSYIYQHGSKQSIPLPAISLCFLVGGALGTIGASLLEYQIRRELGALPLIWVGGAEEAAKLVFPVAIYLRGKYRTELNGIAFGVACGMGFAALETMGYGLMSLIESRGSVGVLLDTLLVKGLLSPAGHAAWTGIVCAVLWRERNRAGGRNVVNFAVLGAFVLAVVLHALWDTFQSLPVNTAVGFVAVEVLSGVVALASLGLLIYRLRQADREGPVPEAPVP